VLEAAAELGYVVNVAARNLRRQRTGTIGIYLPPGVTLQWYYADVALGVTDAAGARGVAALILPQSGDPRAFVPYTDGIVTIDVSREDATARALLESGVPIVTGEAVPEELPRPTGVVFVDHYARAREVLAHLVGRGAARIGVLLPPDDTVWGAEVARAVREFGGAETQSVSVAFSPTSDEIRAACARLVDVDAIIAIPDGTATSVAGFLRAHDHEIGSDVLLASYTDTLADRLLDPPVTALDLRPRELGARLATHLLDVLDGSAANPHEEFDVEWHFRASTRGRLID
jgi:DNA-binding LacI/PurR family transcriptional regulator